MSSSFSEMQEIMGLIRKLNPNVTFGTFHAGKDSLEWCGNVNGSRLKLPNGWKYSKAKGQIIGPKFKFYYWREYRYKLGW